MEAQNNYYKSMHSHNPDMGNDSLSPSKSKMAEAIQLILPDIVSLPVVNRKVHDPHAVKILQNSLWLLGYFFDPTDGAYGEITREALMYFQIEHGVIQNPEDLGAGVFGEKTKAALNNALTQKLRMIEAGEQHVPSAIAGLTLEEERRLARHSIYQHIGHSHNVRNRTYPRRLHDHEILLDTIFSGNNATNSTKILKDILITPKTDGMFFIDIGPGIANKDLDVRGGRGKPAISSQEIAQKFNGVQCFALDMPSEMDIFMGKTPSAQAGYTIDPENRKALLARKNMHLIRGNGLRSLRQQIDDSTTNPCPERPRPTPTKNSTIIIRAANSIDLYANWEKEMKPALVKMAEDFSDNPVVLMFNREILVKPAHSAEWKLIGQVSGMGFRHNDRVLTRSGHPPFFLYEDKVASLKKYSLPDKISQIPAGTEEGAKGENIRNLQIALRALGYFKGEITPNFGPKTKEGLIQLQLACNLIKTRNDRAAGVFGPKTKETLVKKIRLLFLTQQDGPSPISATADEIRTRSYISQNAPEFSPLFRTAPQTLSSIGPLESAVNSIHRKNGFAQNIQPISARDREMMTQERVNHQHDYLKMLRSKYRITTLDNNIQAMLYRENGGNRNYDDDLATLNNSLPPMDKRCKLTIVLPARNEEKRIHKTLTDWISQVGPDGKPLDPKSFEIIVVINRPNAHAAFDHTDEKIDAFKREHPEYNISYVEKTFNFLDKAQPGESPTENVFVNGRMIKMRKGVVMGLIYKVCGDLAVLRNTQRSGVPLQSIADHLVRTGAADAYGRNPQFLHDVMGTFDSYPTLDQYKSGADFPPHVLEKIPVLHIIQRYIESMNRLCAEGNEPYGLGTYRAAVYAEAEGFDPSRALAEELDLTRRMGVIPSTKKHKNVWKSTTINAAEDPRRRLLNMITRNTTLGEYTDFGGKEVEAAIRTLDIEAMNEDTLPSHMHLTGENLGHFMTARFNHYVELAYKNNSSLLGNFQGCFERIKKLTTVSLLAMGFHLDDFDFVSHGSIEKPFGAGKVIIKNISNIAGELQKYKAIKKPDWMLKVR